MPFKPGQSGNPAGRKKGDRAAIANIALEARKHAGAALATLIGLLKNGETGAVRLGAAREILDRAFGRPVQALQIDGELVSRKLHELSDSELAALEQRLLTGADKGDQGQLSLLGGMSGDGRLN